MQYFGYLRCDANVTPDPNYAGYKFWLDKLNSFNGDFHAAEMVSVRRIPQPFWTISRNADGKRGLVVLGHGLVAGQAIV